jgi:hypothetical protein
MCSTVYHPSGETALPCYQIKIAARVLVFIKNYPGSGLRRGDLHHVACWIRSSSSGDVLRVIGRFLSGLTHCERSGQNS